jgi:hypothetical protein
MQGRLGILKAKDCFMSYADPCPVKRPPFKNDPYGPRYWLQVFINENK